MGDGAHKPISEIEIGDMVMATDPETGERGCCTIWCQHGLRRREPVRDPGAERQGIQVILQWLCSLRSTSAIMPWQRRGLLFT